VADPAFLLDSNILIYILDDANAPVVRHIETMDPGSVATSTVAVAEASVGFARRGVNPLALAELLRVIEPLPFDELAARTYGRLPFRRHRFDRLIAAHALSLDLTLVTNNPRDFEAVQGLRVENWTAA
jgi:tRNA(fMet)-specific endonuclease VapC